MRSPFAACRLPCAAAIALLLALPCARAKLAPERWSRLTEEERHQMTRAERYVDQKDYKSALAEYELFLQLYGKSDNASYAQLMFAECTRRLGKVNAAIDEFRNVIDYFPDSIDAGAAQYSMGLAHAQGGDAEKAVLVFEKVVEKWPKEEFGALARSEACTIYWRLGKVEKWLPHIEYLVAGDYAGPGNLRAESQRRLFLHRLISNQMGDALKLVEGTRAKDPLFTFADWASDTLRNRNNIATLYGERGTKALSSIAAAAVAFIEKHPGYAAQKAELELRCVRILAAAGANDQASARYATLVKQSPENDSLRSEYARHLRNAAKFEDARLVYRDMQNHYLGDWETAESYYEEKNIKRAIESYQAMLPKHPDKVADIQWRLGEFLQLSGKYPEAIASFQQSQRDPQALFRIAESQAAMKQFDAAIQTLVGVMNFFKSSAPEAQYKMAHYQAAGGNKEAAIKTLKLVCKNYLNTEWAGRAHQDLSIVYGVDVTLGGAAKKEEL